MYGGHSILLLEYSCSSIQALDSKMRSQIEKRIMRPPVWDFCWIPNEIQGESFKLVFAVLTLTILAAKLLCLISELTKML